jgi:hypothetical protein
MFYVPKNGTLKPYKVDEMLDFCLEYGTHRERLFEPLLQTPEFKKLWEELRKTLTPKYKEGEQAVYFYRPSGTKMIPEVVTVGKVVGWRKVCNRNGGPAEYICTREVKAPTIDKFDRMDRLDEKKLYPLSALNEWKEAHKIVKKLKKEMKKADMIGCTIMYAGSIYQA